MVTSGIGGLCTESCHAQESAIQSVRASRHRRKLSGLLRILPQRGDVWYAAGVMDLLRLSTTAGRGAVRSSG